MTCNRNRLHHQFNRNRRLISRLNLEFLALRQCAVLEAGFPLLLLIAIVKS